MLKVALLGFLIVSVLCMVPLMGSQHAAAGHLHHDASTSCSTCMGSITTSSAVFLLILLGSVTVMRAMIPPLAPSSVLFRPPRTH